MIVHISLAEGHVWVSSSSHRSTQSLGRILGTEPRDLVSYGIWPAGDWPRGNYFQVPVEHIPAVEKVKGLSVMKYGPRGGDIFKRG